MSTQHRHIVVRQLDGDIEHVGFVDQNILDEASIQHIGDEITSLIDRAVTPKLLIDFDQVQHMTSAALGTLITINNRIREKGGQLRLANIHPQIFEVFKITRLDSLFQIHETVAKAADSFK